MQLQQQYKLAEYAEAWLVLILIGCCWILCQEVSSHLPAKYGFVNVPIFPQFGSMYCMQLQLRCQLNSAPGHARGPSTNIQAIRKQKDCWPAR